MSEDVGDVAEGVEDSCGQEGTITKEVESPTGAWGVTEGTMKRGGLGDWHEGGTASQKGETKAAGGDGVAFKSLLPGKKGMLIMRWKGNLRWPRGVAVCIDVVEGGGGVPNKASMVVEKA